MLGREDMSDKRIKICSISIKNFRSIRNETFLPKDFNIFVGLNDVGKSNVLKALNLFFNKQTDYNKEFSFESDFTYLFPTSSHGTKEIKIAVTFDIPDTYGDYGEYVWTKIWRTNDFFYEVILNKNGNEPSLKSRIPSALRRIKYRYVPAVKSTFYFRTLLGDLYKAVSASLNSPLVESTQVFSRAIKDYTVNLSNEVSAKLNMSSELTIPNDLNDIFQSLIFETTGVKNGIHVPLSSRGDGIQARHIPIILKYIADEDQKSRQQGSMKICTIWGFEEPENGLELMKSFQMADNFEEYSKEIQIFTTTHSPAFFMKRGNDLSQVFYVYKKDGNEDTTISIDSSEAEIAEKIGLMPLVAPFIAEQSDKIRTAEALYSKNFLTDIPTIMVEGETDAPILLSAIQCHSMQLARKIEQKQLRIVYKNDGSGTTQLVDWVYAWIYSGFRSKMIVLFDKDGAGVKAKQEIENSEIFRTKQNTISIRIQQIQPSPEILSLYDKKVFIDYEIEHLFSIDFWRKLIKAGLVSARKDEEVYKVFASFMNRNKTLEETINTLVEDKDIRETILLYEPKCLRKKQILELFLAQSDISSITSGFGKTIERLESYFC